MLLGEQGTVCLNQLVKPEELRNVDNSLHREVRRHPLFLMNVFALGLVVFKVKKKNAIRYILEVLERTCFLQR